MFPFNYGEIFRADDDFNLPADADLPDDVMHPNLNSRDYSKRPVNRTPRIHDVWEAIALNAKNQVVIATNKLTGRNWEGVLWGFEAPEKPLTQSNSCFQLQCESLISQMTFIEENLLLVAFTSGIVQLWSTTTSSYKDNNPYKLLMVAELLEHYKPVISLDLFKTNTAKFATGDRGGNMKLWNSAGANLVCTNTYHFAHSNLLTGLDTSYTNENIIATCGYDKSALLWDLRQKKPAIALFENHGVRFNDIAWHAAPGDQENLLTVGDELGFVHTLDARNVRVFVQSTQLLNRPIRKILPKNEKMGIIGNSKTVLVANSSDHEVLYRSENALHFQRDGVWHDDTKLFTVGYDGKLNVHNTSLKPVSS